MANTTTANSVVTPLCQAESSSPKPRKHSPGACTACKSRRTKCIVPSPGMQCDYCRRKELRCIIQSDDQRKRNRPKSRSYVTSLEDRIRALSETLARRVPTTEASPYAQNPNDAAPVVGDEKEPHALNDGPSWMPVFQASGDQDQTDDGGFGAQSSNWGQDVQMLESKSANYKNTTEENHMKSPFSGSKSVILGQPSSTTSGQERHPSEVTVDPGDQSIASPRCSIPGAPISLYNEISLCATGVDSTEKVRCANRVLGDLATTTHDYLMSLYWSSFNDNTMLVSQELFYRDKAMGFRFSDRSRSDIQAITLDTRSSILQQTCRRMAEYELEDPGGISSVQALLILGDLEHGIGKTGSSWAYAGMAFRLACSLGLHSAGPFSKVGKEERRVRITTMRVCVVYDRFYSVWHGRPTTIKSNDLNIPRMATLYMGETPPTTSPSSMISLLCYDAILDLTEYSDRIIEHSSCSQTVGSYFAAAALAQGLQDWYRRLPPRIRWSSNIFQTAPPGYFLLHQHYHYLVILLYRPLTSIPQDSPTAKKLALETVDSPNFLQQLSLSAASSCLDNATRIAQILRFQKQCCDAGLSSIMAVTHARVAALVLHSAIGTTVKESRRHVLVEYLNSILRALREVSAIFEPAAATVNELERIPDNRSSVPGVEEPAICRNDWSAATGAGGIGGWSGIDVSMEESTSGCGVKELEERHSPTGKTDQPDSHELSDTSQSAVATSPYRDSPWVPPMPNMSLGNKEDYLSRNVLDKDPGISITKASQKTGFDALISDLGLGYPRPHEEDTDRNTPDGATRLWTPGSSLGKHGFLSRS